MRKWTIVLLTALLFLSLTMPVWADDGGGPAVLPGENMVIGPGEVVQNDVAVLGGNLELQEGGRVDGDVAVFGGSAIVDGEVDGTLVVVGGTLDLGSHALIRKDLVTFATTVSRALGATVQGETVEGFRGRAFRLPELPNLPSVETWRTTPTQWDQNGFFGLVRSFLRFVLRLTAMVVLGVLLVLLLPRQTAVVEQAVSEAGWTSLAFGVLSFLVLLVLIPLLVLICIGIPVAILLGMAAVAAALFGWVAIGVLLGRRILAALHTSQPQPAIEAIVGVVALTLLSEVPCLGFFVGAVAGTVGLGAVVLTRFGTMHYAPSTPVTDLPAPPPPPLDVPAPPPPPPDVPAPPPPQSDVPAPPVE